MAERWILAAVVAILATICSVSGQNGQNGRALTPPYFNLAVGRQVYSTSTCGEDVSEEELFCKLTGANPGDEGPRLEEYEVIQGQLCDVCNPTRPDKAHPPNQATDGTERWWQSPPLSRGLQYREVNLTIDLGQEFHVAYVFIKMANSPRPGVFALERSTDNGETWKAWQFFADTPSNCHKFFGDIGYSSSIVADDSVVCSTEYSKVVPLEDGEIVVSLVNDRPSAHNFSYAPHLQDFTKATNVRLRLLETKTLQGHLMAVTQQDPTVTRRYFYSIKDISIGGRCVCNGHANVCDKTDPSDPYRLICRCQHNTCGSQCEMCCPGFVQKPWEPATLDDANVCEPCQCHDHTDQCIYDEEVAKEGGSLDIHGKYEGGGVCQNCRHNTEGINCEKCVFGYYRPTGAALNSPYVCRVCDCDEVFSTGDCEDGNGRCKCRPEYTGYNCERCNRGYYGYPHCKECDCNINGTLNEVCEVGGGQCPCKPNYDGNNCDTCAYGYYGFPECLSCGCNDIGSVSKDCHAESGQCTCNANYGGRDCGECSDGNFNYPSCQFCNCDPAGSTEEVCDKYTGRCLCKDNFGGARCEQCGAGFYKYPYCIDCGCSSPGSQLNECDANGQCICKYNYAGTSCDRCASGFYKYDECMACNCDNYGSYTASCDQQSGQCECRPTFEGITCNKCKPNFYNYPHCEECNCNPAGALEVPGFPLGGCGSGQQVGRLCRCKDRVQGRICDECKPGYWRLDINNPQGCEDCSCYRPGTLGGSNVCDVSTGQCICKHYTAGQRCDTCAPGTYNLQEYHYFGCQDCGCDAGGSLNHVCDVESGQCQCRPRVNGRRCDSPLSQHHFPTLYHHKYEMEDGRTESGGQVRYGFDDQAFPDYSWRGYAIFSRLQKAVLVDVDIEQPSLYRLIFRFVNPTGRSVTADVLLTPQASTDVEQTSTVVFDATDKPEYVTVSGGGVTSTFVLNPGLWTISLKSEDPIFVDYLVLLPQAYYEASILQETVNRPCTVPADSSLCKHFTYVDTGSYPTVRGETGIVIRGGQQQRTQLFPDRRVSQELGTTDMAYLDPSQTSLTLNLPVPVPGKYVIIIKYHSAVLGRAQEVDVSVASPGGRADGRLVLPGCPYSSLCREVVVDDSNNAKIFNIDGSYASVTLTADRDVDLAIDELIAIPYEQWMLEYIQPKLKCVRRDQDCIESNYVTPTGTTKEEFESGPNSDRLATDLPPDIIDVGVKVIKLDGSEPTVNVRVSARNTGLHALVIHYYQPNHVGFDVTVDVHVDGQVNRGKFRAEYCPSVSGCRAPIIFDEGGNTTNLIYPDIVLTFNTTSPNPVWVDYIMVIPAIHFKEEVLQVLPVDKSVEFIKYCGQNNFFIDESASGFCRNAVFTLTTEYNNGGLYCDCDLKGSLSFSCNQFAGQCSCRPDVIGRTCSQCRTGYYGFPNCRPCNCPSGLCDSRTGQCVCPPRVTGPDCNICLPRTFGFDPLIGCEDCNCDPEGVMNRNVDCDTVNGQCSCKSNVGGRRCDKCVPGYYRFPRCLQCSCDRRGTTDDICDQRTSSCICKENVEGPQCSQCKPGTYFLEDRNLKGCSTCFCFGTTTLCDSSNLRMDRVGDMKRWAITNLNNAVIDRRGSSDIEVRVNDADRIHRDEDIYWIAPEAYRGNKVTSYGGQLSYTIKNRVQGGVNSDGTLNSDVRIEGSNMTIEYIASRQPVKNVELPIKMDLLETSFRHVDNGAPVSREQFMMVLSRIDSLHIRGSYYTKVNKIILSDVYMDTATRNGPGALARNVEQCQCPSNYRGTSCEECAPGFFRSKSGPYLGACIPCECNGKADQCDPDTGHCTGCRDNFSGPQCLKCQQGYYEDPYTGTCESCACPSTNPENNFATTCTVHSSGVVVSCECLPGYTGSKCDLCDLGYWGNPTQRGGKCRPCDCSGNININDPLSCDKLTGACLKCTNNAEGQRCERCKEWYWGDAIDLKDCQECRCNRVGTHQCDSRNGVCLCKSNVVGPECDNCAPGTFGFDGGNGCKNCDCGLASYSPDCDIYSGQCDCRQGVTGRKCDRCEPGYWNYGPLGCRECQCTADGATTCDQDTGHCQCLPGVTGPKCDQCLPRWVLIPSQGCEECDSCVNLLLDDVDILNHNLTSMSFELKNISAGVLALLRLERINNTVKELRPKVDGLITDPSDPAILDPYKNELKELKEKADRLSKKADRALREAKVNEADAADTRTDAENLDDLIRMAEDTSRDAVRYVEDVLEDIKNQLDNQDIENMLREAEQMLNEIRSRDFRSEDRAAEEELDRALETLQRAKDLERRANDQENRTKDLMMALDNIEDKLMDLINASRHSVDNSQAALDTNTQNQVQKAHVEDLIAKIKNLTADTEMMINMARDMLDEAVQFTDDAERAYGDLERELSKLDQAKQNLKKYTDDLAEENERVRPVVDAAMEHALKLRDQANFLDSMIADTRESAEAALNASRAYQAIVDAINDAENASQQAVDAATEALDKSKGLTDRARRSRARSEKLDESAQETKETVSTELAPRLDKAKKDTMEVEKLNKKTDEELNKLLAGMNMLPTSDLSQRATDAANKAMGAEQKARDANDRIQVIVDKLPDDKRKAEEIPQKIAEANRDIIKAQRQVEDAVDLVPQMQDLLDRLEEKSKVVDFVGEGLAANTSALKEKIVLARGEANRIKVGMQFSLDTTLQVRNPPNIEQAGAYTRMSLYFRTQEPDVFLAYVGPSTGTVGTVQDYMAVEVVGGYVTMKFDLGSGPTEVINDQVKVDDGEWHQVIAERIGRNATVSVRTEDEPIAVVSKMGGGDYNVLDLKSANTEFYVGGVPDHGKAFLSGKLNSLGYIGCLEDVKFDGVPVGLWDFVYGVNNNRGCEARDKLIGVATNGFRFNGNGYVILDSERVRPSNAMTAKLTFKTFSENGLMFLAGDQTDYFAVEMKDGTVLFQYDLGSGPASLRSKEKYNDGQWHIIDAKRLKKDGILKIDGQTEGIARSPGLQDKLSIGPFIYIAGSNEKHHYMEVTNTPFEGCIKDLKIGSTDVNLNDNLAAKGVTPGCSEIARVVSFLEGQANSYISMNPVDVNGDFSLGMKIKTTEKDGLIFYVSGDQAQDDALSVSLQDGKIIVISTATGQRFRLESIQDSYNDGRWHYITFVKQGINLSLGIDDNETMSSVMAGSGTMLTSSPIYFGGLMPGANVVKENFATDVRFVGCVGDVTINDLFVNFAEIDQSQQQGTALSGCPVPDPTPPPTEPPTYKPVFPPTLPPDGEEPQCALSRVPVSSTLMTEGPEDEFCLSGASYVAFDSVPAEARLEYEFSMEFMTTDQDGLLFYAADNRHADFLALYMEDGTLTHSFNCGSGTMELTTDETYNDGQWHTVVFSRDRKRGKMTVDGKKYGPKRAEGSSTSIDEDPPYFVGGMSTTVAERAKANINDIEISFQGAIKNVQLNGIPFETPSTRVGNTVCITAAPGAAPLEQGVFFHDEDSYLTLFDTFNVGLDKEFYLEIRPRTVSGVILSVAAERDFLTIQMVDGNLIFSAENGAGVLTAKHTPAIKNSLCDGKWHTIKAQKAKNVVRVEVDGVWALPGLGEAGVSETNTQDPLYLGGVPETHLGLLTLENYVGCIRNMKIDKVEVDLSSAKSNGKVTLNGCYTD